MNFKGISYLEMLIVLALFMIIASIGGPIMIGYLQRNNMDAAKSMLIGNLRKAQMYSITGKSNADWGVCLTDNHIRLYSGNCESPDINEDFQIPNSVSISGLSDVTFSQMRGEPSSTLNIEIQALDESAVIQMNPVGGISIL